MSLFFARAKIGGWAFGEILTSAQMNTVDADHANAVAGHIAGGLGIESRSVTRFSKHTPFPSGIFSGSGNTVDFDVNPYRAITTVNTAATLHWMIDVPDGATITDWHAYLKGKSGHAGLPAAMPTATLKRVDSAAGLTTIGSTQTDTSGSTAVYQAAHSITPGGGLSEVVVATSRRYFFELISESGANALDTLTFSGVSITFTAGNLDEGAA